MEKDFEKKEKVNERCRKYYEKNKERIKAWKKEWKKANIEKVRGYNRKWWINNQEKVKKWKKENLEKINEGAKKRRFKLKVNILSYYSNNDIRCNCCGEKEIQFLSIDHINGGGFKHKKEIGGNLYNWLIQNNYPGGFQVLCMNCNFGKAICKICPHKL